MSDKIISIKNIGFSYDKKELYRDFSLDVDRNSVFFIMGVNGSGKTTLLKILCSFLKIDSGSIHINEKNLYDYDRKSLSKIVSYVPQTHSLNSDFLVKDYLALGRTPYKSFCANNNEDDYAMVEKRHRTLVLNLYLGLISIVYPVGKSK